MEHLQDMLLEHVIPDQHGEMGKILYSFTEMKIVHVAWPKVSSVDGMFVATNGSLRLQGKYQLQRPGVLGYTKCGEFVFDLGAICLSIKDATEGATSPRNHPRNGHRRPDHVRDVTCTVGHIKVKFHGGAALICQLLTSLYIKMYRRHLEQQISHVIQDTIKDDQQLLVSALTVMAAMNGNNSSAPDSQTDQTDSPPSPGPSSETSVEQSGGRIQRFLDSFRRRTPNT